MRSIRHVPKNSAGAKSGWARARVVPRSGCWRGGPRSAGGCRRRVGRPVGWGAEVASARSGRRFLMMRTPMWRDSVHPFGVDVADDVEDDICVHAETIDGE